MMNNKSFNTLVFILLSLLLSAIFSFILVKSGMSEGDAFNMHEFYKIFLMSFIFSGVLIVLVGSSVKVNYQEDAEAPQEIAPTVQYFYNPYTNGHCIVEKIIMSADGSISSEFNLMNEAGETISEKWYKGVSDFCESDTALVYDGEMYNFINKEGKICSVQWFYDIEPFSDGKAKVRWKDGTVNFVDTTGKVLWKDWRPEISLPKKEKEG